MGNTAFAVVDYGAAYTDIGTFVVTGEAGIIATSKCEAFLDGTQAATADHSPDEHLVAEIDVRCKDIVAGVGFTIVLRSRGPFMDYGKWNVIWIWL